MTKSKTQTAAMAVSWLAVVACVVAIFFFSSQNGDDSQNTSELFAFLLRFPEYTAIIRKLAHFLEFATLGFLISNAFYRTVGNQKSLISFLCGALYAASDEFHQLFVDGRAGRLFDIFIDCLGVITGILLFRVILLLFNRFNLRRKSHD